MPQCSGQNQRRGALHDLLQCNPDGHGEEAAQEHQRVQAGVGRGRNEGQLVRKRIFENSEKKSASNVASNAGQGDLKKARKKSIWRKIFLSREQMKFSYPVLKKAIWLLPIFYVVRWVKVIFTRPKALGQLKKMKDVTDEELTYMKEIRGGLGIKHL